MTPSMEPQRHEHPEGDVKICQECIQLMKTSAEKCRTLSKRSTTPVCRGGLSTAAFVCEGIVKSMEKCIEAMTKNQSNNVEKSAGCCD